jgi:polyisoprenoid-binding protein YceI
MRLFMVFSFFIGALQAGNASVVPHDAKMQTYAADTAHSNVGFSVTHIYVERVTGNVPIVGATVSFAPGSSVPTSIVATLDPKRIETHDPDRNGVLQGPEWFDVKQFPMWTYTSTSIAAKTEGSGFIVNGALTVHGVTQPVILDATMTHVDRTLMVHATGRVDRHAFGMRVTSMDGTIGSDIDLTLDIRLQSLPFIRPSSSRSPQTSG